jgi:hypothetical protein
VLQIWYTRINPAPKQELEMRKLQVLGNYDGNINMPTKIEGVDVLHVSPWTDVQAVAKDRERGINFIGAKVRYLELAVDAETGRGAGSPSQRSPWTTRHVAPSGVVTVIVQVPTSALAHTSMSLCADSRPAACTVSPYRPVNRFTTSSRGPHPCCA